MSKTKQEIKPFTREFLASRGACCGNRCKNCPYVPKWTKGSNIKE